jgi:hypothetical protein
MNPSADLGASALRHPVTSQISHLPVTGYGEQAPAADLQQVLLWLMQLDWAAVKEFVVEVGAGWVLDETFDVVRGRAVDAYRARRDRERAQVEQLAGAPPSLPAEARRAMAALPLPGTRPVCADEDTQYLLVGLTLAAIDLWPAAPADVADAQEWTTACLRSYEPTSAVWLLQSGPIAAVIDLGPAGPDVRLTDMRTAR